ncbi:unnamed protein product, partial [Protopolystoma xenopodis]
MQHHSTDGPALRTQTSEGHHCRPKSCFLFTDRPVETTAAACIVGPLLSSPSPPLPPPPPLTTAGLLLLGSIERKKQAHIHFNSLPRDTSTCCTPSPCKKTAPGTARKLYPSCIPSTASVNSAPGSSASPPPSNPSDLVVLPSRFSCTPATRPAKPTRLNFPPLPSEAASTLPFVPSGAKQTNHLPLGPGELGVSRAKAASANPSRPYPRAVGSGPDPLLRKPTANSTTASPEVLGRLKRSPSNAPPTQPCTLLPARASATNCLQPRQRASDSGHTSLVNASVASPTSAEAVPTCVGPAPHLRLSNYRRQSFARRASQLVSPSKTG